MSALAILVSIATWLAPSPTHAQGLIVRYGPQWLVESVAEYRGYDLSPYANRCGLSLISPSDLGKIVWVRFNRLQWYGPCLSIDTASREHFYQVVYRSKEVAEVPNSIAEHFGFCCGRTGEVFIGLCPPLAGSPSPYRPILTHDFVPLESTPSMWPYPAQQLSVHCNSLELDSSSPYLSQ